MNRDYWVKIKVISTTCMTNPRSVEAEISRLCGGDEVLERDVRNFMAVDGDRVGFDGALIGDIFDPETRRVHFRADTSLGL